MLRIRFQPATLKSARISKARYNERRATFCFGVHSLPIFKFSNLQVENNRSLCHSACHRTRHYAVAYTKWNEPKFGSNERKRFTQWRRPHKLRIAIEQQRVRIVRMGKPYTSACLYVIVHSCAICSTKIDNFREKFAWMPFCGSFTEHQ